MLALAYVCVARLAEKQTVQELKSGFTVQHGGVLDDYPMF